jgi:hypothetical protein
MMAGETPQRCSITPPGGVAQFLGAAAQPVQVGPLGKRVRHGVSLVSLRSAAQAEEGPRIEDRRFGGGLSPSRGPGGTLKRQT